VGREREKKRNKSDVWAPQCIKDDIEYGWVWKKAV
jgi:hypothetical protein